MKKEELGPDIFGHENGHLSTHFPKMKGYGLSLVRTQQQHEFEVRVRADKV
jgi:hypothetical protein